MRGGGQGKGRGRVGSSIVSERSVECECVLRVCSDARGGV